MAKYAKHIAAMDQCTAHLNEARSLVEGTVQYWKLTEIS